MSKKFYFVANLIVGSVGLTFSLMSWFMTDFYNGLHLLMTISGTASLAYALSMYDSLEDPKAEIDDSEWHLLECMLTSYREYYKDAYKDTYMYESGMRDIDGWISTVEDLRK